MEVPSNLDYDMWLGPAFPAPYTLKRVHDRHTISTRPGWLRISDYCNGMITNWGAHLNDIALWGIKKEYEHKAVIAQKDAEMEKRLDQARADIVAGKIKVTDFMAK